MASTTVETPGGSGTDALAGLCTVTYVAPRKPSRHPVLRMAPVCITDSPELWQRYFTTFRTELRRADRPFVLCVDLCNLKAQNGRELSGAMSMVSDIVCNLSTYSEFIKQHCNMLREPHVADILDKKLIRTDLITPEHLASSAGTILRIANSFYKPKRPVQSVVAPPPPSKRKHRQQQQCVGIAP